MTEGQFSSTATDYLNKHDCLAFKHADGFTTGVPDHSVTNGHIAYTTWLEFKYLKRGESLRGRVHKDKVQYINMLRIGAMTGRAFYVVGALGMVHFFHPKAILYENFQIFNQPANLVNMLRLGNVCTVVATDWLETLLEVVTIPDDIDMRREVPSLQELMK